MIIRKLLKCKEFVSGDGAFLRELLHASKGNFKFRYSLAHAIVKPGRKTVPHKLKAAEVYYIIKGRGLMHVGPQSQEVTEGDAAYVPPGKLQYIENAQKSDLVFLCIVDPAWRREDEEIVEPLPRTEVPGILRRGLKGEISVRNKQHLEFMKEAIKEAKKGLKDGGVPIGAVLVKAGRIIGRGHNRRVQKNSAILHAEMDCLENAGRLKAGEYKKCIIYSTLSPCDMCSGAILLYKIPVAVVGENRTFKGPEDYMRGRGVKIINLDSGECKKLMRGFILKRPQIWYEDIGE